MKQINIKQLRIIYSVMNEQDIIALYCGYVGPQTHLIEIQKPEFEGVEISRETVKYFFRMHTGIEVKSGLKYFVNDAGSLLLN
jgi:hypothetical protein